MTLDQLNNNYALGNHLDFVAGKGGFPCIRVRNQQAQALISVYGGQVLSFLPNHMADVLFVSRNAYFETGKAIKGGIPVCWPWFGPDPAQQGRAAHGFVRNRLWEVLATAAEDDATLIRLGLHDDDETRAIWPHAFRLTLTIRVGRTLQLALLTDNTGDQPFRITQALHTYFAVGDIRQVNLSGLDGLRYIDNAANGYGQVKAQSGNVTVADEVDRIYQDTPAELMLADDALGRRIRIVASGSRSTVVWNPWAGIAARMGDLHDDDYKRFLCVETANAADDVVEVPAGGAFRLAVEYSL